MLGQAEKYMSIMADLSSAFNRLEIMKYKLQFIGRIYDLKQVFQVLASVYIIY